MMKSNQDAWGIIEGWRKITANTSATSESSPAQAARYHYLAPKPGSNYQQLFVNGRIRAEILYRETIGTELLTPEQVADEYGVPVAAVLESIAYCQENQSLLNAERDRESARIEAGASIANDLHILNHWR